MFEYFSGDGGRKKRQIVKERQYHNKWSEGVYYIFNETAKNKPRLKGCFLKAARAWELNTCIDFKQGRPEKPDYGYLAVTDEYEYMSHVGRLGEEQPLSIGESCETEFGRAIHEVGHALGLYHFHSRYDRDSEYILKFLQHKDHEVEYAMVLRNESRNYGTSYDYGSVMHYGVNSENPVMIPANRYHNRTMGSAIISLVDYWLINKHYGCLENISLALLFSVLTVLTLPTKNVKWRGSPSETRGPQWVKLRQSTMNNPPVTSSQKECLRTGPEYLYYILQRIVHQRNLKNVLTVDSHIHATVMYVFVLLDTVDHTATRG
ncbi:hypothetical protein Y032_0038g3645 [Ancylostoma ceylanicum]|uniref:Metalloendopeptidase n=1 Tax=Ancylostoma ceylanicum TaxID=53326 RepID=A0A016UJP9_9BILA|nr:hypothetical protein Y032_0038g3645 [Ancylostoma ceylanicum]